MQVYEILKNRTDKSEADFLDIEFLSDDPLLGLIASIFVQIPDELLPMVGVTGKKYEAIRDYCEWHGLKKSVFVPLLVQMGQVYASKMIERDNDG